MSAIHEQGIHGKPAIVSSSLEWWGIEVRPVALRHRLSCGFAKTGFSPPMRG